MGRRNFHEKARVVALVGDARVEPSIDDHIGIRGVEYPSNDPDNCQMVPLYSNPNVTVTTEYLTDSGDLWTFTTGAPHNSAAPADNAAVISEFASCSAQYRARTDRIFADPFE